MTIRIFVSAVLTASVFLSSQIQADAYSEYRENPSADTAFAYIHQVASHPRCGNCHGAVENGLHRPTVGDRRKIHPMNISFIHNLVLRAEGDGFVQIPDTAQPVNCRSCHHNSNGASPGMPPGAANDLMPGFVWHMPPVSMLLPADISPAMLCEKWLDPASNSFLAVRGGRDDMKTFEKEFVHHASDDPLVRWSWNPGPGRTPAPGTHADFVAAMKLWIRNGAACPDPS